MALLHHATCPAICLRDFVAAQVASEFLGVTCLLCYIVEPTASFLIFLWKGAFFRACLYDLR